MKKTFLSIAILASSIFAFAATNTPTQSASPASTEQTAPAKQGKGKKDGRKGSDEGRQAREDRLFEGLNLTENQKERLAALREKNKAERNAAANNKGKERGENLTPEQRGQMKARKASGRKAFLADVKEILTPEQYVTFLENSFSLRRDNQKMHKAHRGDNKKQHDRNKASSAKKGAKTDKSRS